MTTNNGQRCAFITLWLGPFPVWMDFFLASSAHNGATFDWLLFTDQPRPEHAPPNVRFFPLDLATVNQRIAEYLPYDVTINTAYKLCDLKPFFGLLFSEELEGYGHWGYCDIDVVWGHLERFLVPDMRKGYDIVTVDSTRPSGFCTVYKNEARLKRLCLEIPHAENLLREESYRLMEEWHLPQVLAMRPDITISYALRYLEQPDRHTVVWENGRLFGDEREYAVLHTHTWYQTKYSMTVESADLSQKSRWLITREGFFSGEHISLPLPPTPRISEGVLIRANGGQGDDALSLIQSIRACDDRPILLIDCGLHADQREAIAHGKNVMVMPLHSYSPDSSQPALLERSPFDHTLWLAPHCFVLQSLDEAFLIMREHLLIGMHHDALRRGIVDTIRGPAALRSFPKGDSKYPPMFHLSADVLGYRKNRDAPVTDAWKQGLQSRSSHTAEMHGQNALLWAVMIHCPHIVWAISSTPVWNAVPLSDDFSGNREKGHRIVNRSWSIKLRPKRLWGFFEECN